MTRGTPTTPAQRHRRPRHRALMLGLGLLVAACGSADRDAGTTTGPPPPAGTTTAVGPGPGRGFPVQGPWVAFYGASSRVDIPRVAATFRVIDIDADPDRATFTRDQLQELKAGGRNTVCYPPS